MVTAKDERRAHVALEALKTLWFNAGTLCNLTCENCYIESSPRNVRLVYLTTSEVAEYLDEIQRDGLGTELICFTGGEPFMNLVPSGDARSGVVARLSRPGADQCDDADAQEKNGIAVIAQAYGDRLTIRVSIDHYGWRCTSGSMRWLPRPQPANVRRLQVRAVRDTDARSTVPSPGRSSRPDRMSRPFRSEFQKRTFPGWPGAQRLRCPPGCESTGLRDRAPFPFALCISGQRSTDRRFIDL